MTSSFKSVISSTILVLVSSTAFSAFAQSQPAPTTPTTPTAPTQGARTAGQAMKALDTNNDKLISRDEAKGKPRLTKNFDAIDTNKDGVLSASEMKAYRKAHKGEGKAKS